MAEKEKSKSGIMPLILGLVVVTVIGLGAGFGLSKMLVKPETKAPTAAADPAAAKPAGEAHADPKAQGEAKDGAKTAPPPETETAAAADFNPAELKDVVLTPFTPVTANLSVPDTVWIRLEGSMAVKPKDGTKPADVVVLATNKMVPYLKTLKLADIQGPVGFMALNSDLNEIVRSATDGQARAVLITGFIVE
jgi:hypothetical protein